jgi:hypothetical protein
MRQGNLLQWGTVVTGLLSLMLMSATIHAAGDGQKEQKKSTVDDAKEKAADAIRKLKDNMKDAESKDMEDVKKQASDKVNEGKEALGKKVEDLKAELEKKKAAAKKKGASDEGDEDGKGNDKAKGEADHPGKHLGQEKQDEKADSDSDSDTAGATETEKERVERLRRREMGYLMHRRYLDGNEKHSAMMKQISERKGLKIAEQRKHIKRIARLERVRELAVDKNDTPSIEKVDELIARETERHESVMVKLHSQAKQGNSAGQKEGN